MIETISATEPQAVQIEQHANGTADVWLRKNIEQDTADNGMDNEGYTFWRADEAHILVSGTPDPDEVAGNFTAWWAKAEGEDVASLESLQADVDTLLLAVAELGDMIGGE